MLKLLKWEMSHTWISFATVLGLFCLSLLSFYFVIAEIIFNNLFSEISTFMLFSSLGALFFLSVLMVIQTFGKFLFGDMGHLLFCLPISLDKILLAKLLACTILIGISVLVVANGFLLVYGLSEGNVGDFYLSFFTFLENNLDFKALFFFMLSAICRLIATLIKVLLVLSILNVLHVQSFKLILGILIFTGINIVWGTITGIFLSFSEVFIRLGKEYMIFVIHCICDFSFAVGGYFLSRFLIKYNLELE
ncbi:MAG: hypothetical protein J6B32_02075 [Spirochaetaceae bacterium]|nr:hypothetical protein [Spirochaetaceae bacterium]